MRMHEKVPWDRQMEKTNIGIEPEQSQLSVQRTLGPISEHISNLNYFGEPSNHADDLFR